MQHAHGTIETIRTVQVQSRAEPYDAIVVGSGISGGWAAKELTQKGLKTLVLERGPAVAHGAGYVTEHRAPWQTPFRGRGDRRHAEARQFRQVKAGPYNENTAHWYVDDVDHPYQTGEDDAADEFLWVPRPPPRRAVRDVGPAELPALGDGLHGPTSARGAARAGRSDTPTSRRGTATSSALSASRARRAGSGSFPTASFCRRWR